MKTLLYIAILFMPLIVLAQPAETTKSVSAETNWSGRHCRGTHGLCNINKSSSNVMNNTLILFNLEDESIVFTIYKDKLSKSQEVNILGKPFESYNRSETLHFVMAYDFVLNDELRNELNMPITLTTIKSGEYLIDIVKDTFVITFKLK